MNAVGMDVGVAAMLLWLWKVEGDMANVFKQTMHALSTEQTSSDRASLCMCIELGPHQALRYVVNCQLQVFIA